MMGPNGHMMDQWFGLMWMPGFWFTAVLILAAGIAIGYWMGKA